MLSKKAYDLFVSLRGGAMIPFHNPNYSMEYLNSQIDKGYLRKVQVSHFHTEQGPLHNKFDRNEQFVVLTSNGLEAIELHDNEIRFRRQSLRWAVIAAVSSIISVITAVLCSLLITP